MVQMSRKIKVKAIDCKLKNIQGAGSSSNFENSKNLAKKVVAAELHHGICFCYSQCNDSRRKILKNLSNNDKTINILLLKLLSFM
jgi:hypothetical protein